jgi:hypothetical protein
MCLIPDETELRHFIKIDNTCCSFRSTRVQDQGLIYHYYPHGSKMKDQVSRNQVTNLVGHMFISLLCVEIEFLQSRNILVDKFIISALEGIAGVLLTSNNTLTMVVSRYYDISPHSRSLESTTKCSQNRGPHV